MSRYSHYNQRIRDCEDKLERLELLFKFLDAISSVCNCSVLLIKRFLKIVVIVFILLLTIFSILFYPAVKLWVNDIIINRYYIKPWINKHDDPLASNRKQQLKYIFYDYLQVTEGYNYYYDMHSKCLHRALPHNITNKFKQEINEYYGSDKYYNHYQKIYNQNMTILNNTIKCKLNDINPYLDFKQVCNIKRQRLASNLRKRFQTFESKKARTFDYLVCNEYKLKYEKMIAERNQIYSNYSIIKQEMCDEKRLIETKLSAIGIQRFHSKYSTLRPHCTNYMHCGEESDEIMHEIWLKCYESDWGKYLKNDISIDVTKFMFEFKGI